MVGRQDCGGCGGRGATVSPYNIIYLRRSGYDGCRRKGVAGAAVGLKKTLRGKDNGCRSQAGKRGAVGLKKVRGKERAASRGVWEAARCGVPQWLRRVCRGGLVAPCGAGAAFGPGPALARCGLGVAFGFLLYHLGGELELAGLFVYLQ